MAAPFVLVLPGGEIAGFYTLSATAVRAPELPADIVRKLPRYPLIRATPLGRSAVDQRYRGSGYGRTVSAGGCAVAGGAERDRFVRGGGAGEG
jgi:hypothetical protein